MKPFLACVFLAAAASLPAAPSRSIFDGRTFDGWEGDTKKWWRIQEGCIVGGSLKEKVPHNDFLATTRAYTNFVVRLKFRLLGTNGFINSGVQIRSQRVPNDHEMAGYQCDLGDPSWWGSIYDESRRNKLMAQSDMAAINKVLKRGDWNDYLIRAEGRRIRTYINGTLGVDYTEADPAIVQWGRLGLQVHGGGAAEAWFKDIEIEELPALPESPLSPKDQKASFQLPPGFEIDLIAAEPDLPKPITVAFDDAGRMWSITAVEYPVDANENQAQAEALFQQGGRDKILVFDPLPSGAQARAGQPLAYGKPRVFADGLVMPLGILPYKDGAIIQYGTEVRFLRDTDGDGRADKREMLLSGFGIQDSHLFPHQFTRAPGGWFYLAQGAFNYSKVRTTDGVVVQFDQTKLARFRPDGSAFEILTHGPCNIWGLVINPWGETFIQEANDYGYPVIHFQPGINVPGCGDRTFQPYAPRQPSIADFRMGGTGLSGLALSEDPNTFPDPWHDVMFVANPIVRQVQAIKIHRDGSGYKLERLPDFLSSSDDWFRPVAIHFGPDGGLYVVDWYNKIISHNEVPRNHPERDKTRGRVWRVRHRSGPAAEIPNVARASSEALLTHLVSGNGWEWRAALNRIADRPAPELAPRLASLALTPHSQGPAHGKEEASEGSSQQIRALWALESLGPVDPSLLGQLLGSPDRNVRREAVRAAGSSLPVNQRLPLLAALAEDPDHQVRAELIRAISGQAAPWKHLILEGAAKRPDLALDAAAIEMLVRMAKPALPGADQPGPGYERAFERYLIRGALERHPAALASFLDDPASRSLPVENRRLACAALRNQTAARALAALLKASRFQPTDEEWILLQRHSRPGDLRELYPVYPWAIITEAAVRRGDLIVPATDHGWILEAAGHVLRDKAAVQAGPEQQTLALQAVRTFKLKEAEPEVLDLLERDSTPPNMKIAALQTLREIQPEAVDAIHALASNPSEPVEVRNEAVATLAASRNPQAASRLLNLWPSLPASLRPRLLQQLASSKSGAQILLDAISRDLLLPDDLSAATLKNMRTLLGENPQMAKLWSDVSARMQPVLRLEGGNDDYVSAKITLEGPFTVETWVHLDPGISNHDGILGHAGSADLNFYAERFRFYAGDKHGDVVVATKKIAPNQWTHLAVTRNDRGEFRLYINGELDAVGTKLVTETFGNLDIGRTIPTAGGTAGSLTEFRIWNRARTAAEILAHFDRSFAGEPPRRGLVLSMHGPDSLPGPLRGKARMEGTLDTPPFLTVAEAVALEGLLVANRQLAQSEGDAARGRRIFETACMICHQVGGQGSNLAPPLDGAAHRGIDGLLRAILTPNAAIESGYRKFQVQTIEDELAEGFLVSQDAAGVLLRQPTVGEQRIPADRIKRASYSRVSLMPEGLLQAMPGNQVSDLFAFLLSLK